MIEPQIEAISKQHAGFLADTWHEELAKDIAKLWPSEKAIRETLHHLLSGTAVALTGTRWDALYEGMYALYHPPQPVWCEHWTNENHIDVHGYAKGVSVYYPAQDIKFCPICATPRPGAKDD